MVDGVGEWGVARNTKTSRTLLQ